MIPPHKCVLELGPRSYLLPYSIDAKEVHNLLMALTGCVLVEHETCHGPNFEPYIQKYVIQPGDVLVRVEAAPVGKILEPEMWAEIKAEIESLPASPDKPKEERAA
jgi:hypothetical protein